MTYTNDVHHGYIHRLEDDRITLIGPERLSELTADRDLVSWSASEPAMRHITLTLARKAFDLEAGDYRSRDGGLPQVLVGLASCKSPLWELDEAGWSDAGDGAWTLSFDLVARLRAWLGDQRPPVGTAFRFGTTEEDVSNLGASVTVA